jgi:serine phosphatase RsbU (regulator of sigma subunit)
MTSGEDDDAIDRTITIRAMVPPQAAPAVGHFLAYTDRDQTRRVPIGLAGLTIGRQAPSDLAIPAPEISRRHCRIDLDDEWATVTNLNSTNGTFVGGQRVTRTTRLRDGSQLSLDSFQIRYERRDPREVAEEEELAAELRRAMDYARAILSQPIEHGPVRADWWFVPALQLGGDAFGYQFLDDVTFTGFVLDVSGHGIGSAMHAANVANTLRRRALPGVDFREPARVAAGLNTVFPMEEHNELMLTIWYFVYELTSRTLRFCSAGHHPSYLVSPGGQAPEPLWFRGPAIGMLPKGKWTEGSVAVAPSAQLCVFSDGAFEIVDANGREWGIEDLRRQIAAASGPVRPRQAWDAIRAAVRPGPLDDDFSVLAITFEQASARVHHPPCPVNFARP